MSRERMKWTTEEEEALFAGVEKHGHGKWKVILTDPQFASTLKNRSNIDLKDKWRNISVNRDKVKSPMLEIVTETPMSEEVTNKAISPLNLDSPNPLSVVHLIEDGGTTETPISEEVTTITKTPSRTTIDRRIAPDYEAMILEALCYNEGNGADIVAILNFIQERYELPEKFERSVTSMLRRLVLTGELQKVDNLFKIYGESPGVEAPVQKDAETPVQEDVGPCKDNKQDEKKEETEKCNSPLDTETTCEDNKQDEEKKETDKFDSPIDTETTEDATLYAGNVVSRAENSLQKAIEACQEADRFAEIVDESMAMLTLAEEIYERCLLGEVVLLRP